MCRGGKTSCSQFLHLQEVDWRKQEVSRFDSNPTNLTSPELNKEVQIKIMKQPEIPTTPELNIYF